MTETCRSLLTRFYYSIKPMLPRNVRWAARRYRATGIRKGHAAVWPIHEAAGATPDGWLGWPEGKRFALVLTHDVESQVGLNNVQALAQLEMKHGFRSSFNFIPEGGYRVPESMREWLVENGFEVGVHDLHHDGKLYQSRAGFVTRARCINHYLREWKAIGFRSGFMLRELAWLHDLDIDYDCSTFDTDPFEPQPTGSHTIFPYWIGRPDTVTSPGYGQGYVELPYTLPQDSTMFLLLREPNGEIWKRKTEWIVERGGMVLVNVHPDYMHLSESAERMTYPITHYDGFLRWVKEEYQGEFWQALPREISRFVRDHTQSGPPKSAASPMILPATHGDGSIKIWIDLENTPHIPFFRPILSELSHAGHRVVLTARDGYQTCEMARFYSLNYQQIGRHYGRRLISKGCGLLVRGCQLVRFAWREKPTLALNLGSRSQNLAAKLMGIPVVEIMDYEHTAEPSLLKSRWYLMPEAVHAVMGAGNSSERMRTYAGIKEDVYVPDFLPDDQILDQLGLRDARVVVTARPPATEAHYHNPEAELWFARFIDRALACSGVKIVLLPRSSRQEAAMRDRYPQWFANSNLIVPTAVVDGLNLIWHSDLIVSGGGTMNREAAALGVPVYSVFRGRCGAVDRHLAKLGRLVLIESPEDVDQKILLEPRALHSLPDPRRSGALSDILGHLNSIIASLTPRPRP